MFIYITYICFFIFTHYPKNIFNIMQLYYRYGVCDRIFIYMIKFYIY